MSHPTTMVEWLASCYLCDRRIRHKTRKHLSSTEPRGALDHAVSTAPIPRTSLNIADQSTVSTGLEQKPAQTARLVIFLGTLQALTLSIPRLDSGPA